MSSLKPEMQALCKEVATEFDGWNFVGDVFKNKTLRAEVLSQVDQQVMAVPVGMPAV